MCLVSNVFRTKFFLLFSAFLGISNIFLIFNYRQAKRFSKNNADNIYENDQLLSVDLKRLQIEINETFQRFEEIRERSGKVFDLAALYGGNLKGSRDDDIKRAYLPPLPDCKQAPFLLIQIPSTPANIMERQAIRMSWGRPENRINRANAGIRLTRPRLWKTVFLLGQTHNPRLDELLRDEATIHEDLVFGDFTDSYRNLTKKMALGIKWAAKHCQAEYVMKADEDSFVNVIEVIQLLKERQRNTSLYMGAALIDTEPYREPESQFYVSEDEYPGSKYPPYAAGPGYVFSGRLLRKLYRALNVVRLFPNEDACFGALMQYIKVNITHNKRFIPFTTGTTFYSEYEGYSLCKFNGPLVIHRISGKLQIQTHFNVLVLKHVPTVCEHIKNGIGNVDYMWNSNSFSLSVFDNDASSVE